MAIPSSFRVVAAVLPLAGVVLAAGGACVPSGSSKPSGDGGAAPAELSSAAAPNRPSINVMKEPFEDSFDRPAKGSPPAASASAPATASATIAPSSMVGAKALARGVAADVDGSRQGDATAQAPTQASSATANTDNELGPDWTQAGGTTVWHIENGKLCGQGARNHGVWLNRTLPVNARIEFDAVSFAPEGDLKAEVWGDGRSYATGTSYTNATSYLAIFGGWDNRIHALARLNEHGHDRKEIAVDMTSDDPRQRPVVPGQLYHFKIERTDGRTVHWFIDGQEMRTYTDPQPLVGMGHDHFAFNDWNAKVCFDNVKVTPL